MPSGELRRAIAEPQALRDLGLNGSDWSTYRGKKIMKLSKTFIAIPAIALAAGLGLAACGRQSASHAAVPTVTHSAAAAPTTAAPKPPNRPSITTSSTSRTSRRITPLAPS